MFRITNLNYNLKSYTFIVILHCVIFEDIAIKGFLLLNITTPPITIKGKGTFLHANIFKDHLFG